MESHLYEEMARHEQAHWWFLGRRAVIRSVMQRYVTPGGKLLDVGCGTGGMLPMLSEFGAVEGLESSPEALKFCRDNFGGIARVIDGSIPNDIPGGAQYDVVTAFDVLEHLDDPVEAIRRIRAALKPGGLFVCAVPAFQFLWSAHDQAHHHRKRYTQPLLRRELHDGGLTPVWSSYFNSLLFPPVAAVRTLGRLLPRRSSSNEQSDLQPVPAPMNALLRTVFAAERFVVPRLPLPFGVSLLAVARAS